jgi:hypothetical protein
MTRSWPDRHPAAATTAGLFTLTLLAMMLSVHPVAAAALVAIAALAVGAWMLDRERDRRAATAARADAATRDLMRAMSTPKPIRLAPTQPPPRGAIAQQHVMNRYPTTPLKTQPIGAQP